MPEKTQKRHWPDHSAFWPAFDVPELPSRPMPDHDTWLAFSMPWDDNSPGPTDMSGLLHTPAGAKGFMQVVDGHLATGDGARWRIWGQNMTANAPLPPMHMAPAIARRLAKFGLNCIRLHHIDHRWPSGILIRSSTGQPVPHRVDGAAARDNESTRALDPEAMARLDWFIACCKKNGVYIDLNLNVSRPFSSADGVKQVDWIGFGKAVTYFDERLVYLQKEYATQLLEHVNPFTGNRYADEPAIAIIEFMNENSLLDFWAGRDCLRGEGRKPVAEVGDIPPAYAEQLDRRWNARLAKRYDDRDALRTAWEGDLGDTEDPVQGSVRRLCWADFESASGPRFREEAEFYAQIERDFFLDMQTHLRSLGAKQLLVGTSNFHHTWSALPMLETNAALDVMDGHTYWQHPRFPGSGWARTNWLIQNTPMVDDPDHASPTQLSRSAVEGLPYIASELNEPFPNDYAAEFIPIVAAYALLQDWDGLFWFAYGGGTEKQWKDNAIGRYFYMANDPVKMAETSIGALAFLRGDVQAARETIRRRWPHDLLIESLRTLMPEDDQRPYWQPYQYDEGHPYWLPYLPGRLALVHRTVLSDFNAETLSPVEGAIDLLKGTARSDTGELTWEATPGDGCVRIDAPRYQAIIGRAGRRETQNIELDLETPFAVVELVSLDDRPLSEADRMLLVTVARVANTGMKWVDDTRMSLGDQWGHGPTRIEPVAATLRLRGLTGATDVALQPLDGCGQAVGQPVQTLSDGDGFVVALPANPATVWYEISIAREHRL